MKPLRLRFGGMLAPCTVLTGEFSDPVRVVSSISKQHRPWHAARLVRKERSDGSPHKVREFISHDSTLRFGSLNHAYIGVRNVDFRSEMGRIADMLQICQKRRE